MIGRAYIIFIFNHHPLPPTLQDMLATAGSDQNDVGSLTADNRDELMDKLKRQHQSQINQINAQREAQKKAMLQRMRVKVH